MEVLRRMLVLLWMLDGLLHVKGKPTLTFEPEIGIIGQTIQIACNLTGYHLPNMELSLNGRDVYVCGLAGLDCAHRGGISDYSKVHWTQTSMGIVTISNLNKSRDAGKWICSVLTDESEPTFLWVKADCGNLTVDKGDVSYINDTLDQSSAKFNCKSGYQLNGNSTRTCLADGTWSGISPICTAIKSNGEVCWYFTLILIPFSGLIISFIIVSRYKTLVISTLYVKVTKNTGQLSWKPEFEPVPNTIYAKCAQNGLTENAEFIDGLFVVVLRDLVPEKQHDVTVYCQNKTDMKLYKSETFAVFTLKDSSNTNPKEGNTVLALHSLDLTVYQTNVELSWTSPIAFDSTKVEYWFGSDKHITMSATKTSLATSNAELTRLLPDSVITFTITGEKHGTQYRSGVLHQKTLKGLTGCCP